MPLRKFHSRHKWTLYASDIHLIEYSVSCNHIRTSCFMETAPLFEYMLHPTGVYPEYTGISGSVIFSPLIPVFVSIFKRSVAFPLFVRNDMVYSFCHTG